MDGTTSEMLPRMPAGVLLVEEDDATLRIIASLLRKCGYKVTTATDGLKAWEMLRSEGHDIDLVLTEVDLPTISGFNLLASIMDHESTKNIPVIMISSRDSISLVLKCMLRGAADYLVKPIRKNELSNLWQHIWRRNNVNFGHRSKGNENDVRNRVKSEAEKEIAPGEYAGNKGHNYELNYQHSDIQSSCTKLDLGDAYEENVLHQSTNIQNDSKKLQLYNESVIIPDINLRAEPLQDDFDAMNENDIQEQHKPRDEKMSQNEDSDISDDIHQNDFSKQSCYMPYVELMMGRYEETNVLNHSKSSAFSTYLPTSLARTQCKGYNLNCLGNAMDIDTQARDEVAANVSKVFGSMPSERSCSSHEPVPLTTFPGILTRGEASIFENTPRQNDREGDLARYVDENCSKSALYQVNIEEKVPISVCTAESGSNSICSTNVSRASSYNGHGKQNKQVSAQFLSQREVALNRFRLKKKDRCFKKKVRYESRKVIAEHRPRVKGQFVGKNRICA